MTRAMRVLLAEDDDGARDDMREMLESDGYEVVAVGDGAEALAYLQRDRPALVVLDLQIDDVSGWEILRYLRQRQVKVLVTGREAPSLPRGVPFLGKPVSRDRLLDACRHA